MRSWCILILVDAVLLEYALGNEEDKGDNICIVLEIVGYDKISLAFLNNNNGIFIEYNEDDILGLTICYNIGIHSLQQRYRS